MVYVICDFLNAYGFNGIKFHVYDGDDNDIETMTDDDKIVGFVGCDEVVDITYSNKRGRMVGHYYFDFNDPELFAKLKVAVGDILRVEV